MRIFNVIFKYRGVILNSFVILVLLLTNCSVNSNNNVHHHRVKRNLGQFLALITMDTPYVAHKLSKYGNWCGRGGDRMGDGSWVDGCDLCCKQHDECYYESRHKYKRCHPMFTMYHYRHGNPYALNATEKIPLCYTEQNKGPSCKEAICQCDVDFVVCMKKEPCDPKLVSKNSRLWWLPG